MDPKNDVPRWWPRKPKVVPPKAVRGTEIVILGCGTSTGVPVLACRCSTCRSRDPRNRRTRASVAIRTGNRCFLIDTAPDLITQALRNGLHWVDAVLFTHPHADHIHGLDDLRSFNYLMARTIPCYGNRWLVDTLRTRFDYIFRKTQVGGGKPLLDLYLIEKKRKISGIPIQPLPLVHGRMNVLGYRINNVAYITDCSYIQALTFRCLKDLDVLVLDCLRPSEHPTHLNVEMALTLAARIGAKRTYFTHMGHEIEYKSFARSLPKNMYPAHDGLVISAI